MAAPTATSQGIANAEIDALSAATEAAIRIENAVDKAYETVKPLDLGGTDGTAMLDPGASETITIGPFDASTEAWCTVPGHREAGMSMRGNPKRAFHGAE